MKKIKLIKPIPNAAGDDTISTIQIKEESEICAYDFYSVELPINMEKIEIKAFEPAICSLCNLTSAQVAAMNIKDYMSIAGEVGKYFL